MAAASHAWFVKKSEISEFVQYNPFSPKMQPFLISTVEYLWNKIIVLYDFNRLSTLKMSLPGTGSIPMLTDTHHLQCLGDASRLKTAEI